MSKRHEEKKQAALKAVEDLHGDTSVDHETTAGSLEEIITRATELRDQVNEEIAEESK